MEHGVDLDINPTCYTNKEGDQGQQRILIEDKKIPLKFDGRKTYLEIRRPAPEELDMLEVFEMTSPTTFNPTKSNDIVTCRDRKKKYKQYPGGLTIQQWQDRLGLAPEDVIRKTFEATTQLVSNVEVENRTIGRNHYKSRFPFLREKRLNDEFHTDTFFPSEETNDGNTCSQIFLGKNTDYMHVALMNMESHATQALQDFGRNIGLPKGIKSDNAATETGFEWNNWCRKYCVKTTTTEPHSPWQNASERGIGDLGRMVKRNMEKFNAPLSRHGWCQLHCEKIRNHIASRKLNWRTPQEMLIGDTPDISNFRFHFWEPIEYWDPRDKQPRSGWKKGRFLGINWSAGDNMTYYVETEKDPHEGRNVVLTRSNVRSRRRHTNISPSGETDDHTDNGEAQTENEAIQPDTNDINQQEPQSKNESIRQQETRYEMDQDITFHDDVYDDPFIEESIDNKEDETEIGLLGEEIENIINAEEEDYEFRNIVEHRWEAGLLLFTVELESGHTYEIPFSVIKKDRPLKLARYVKNNVV